MKISPSLMCMDLLKFKEQIEFIDSHADYFHIDIMDGHFVPNLTLSPFFVSQVKKTATKPPDCHLMGDAAAGLHLLNWRVREQISSLCIRKPSTAGVPPD